MAGRERMPPVMIPFKKYWKKAFKEDLLSYCFDSQIQTRILNLVIDTIAHSALSPKKINSLANL